MSDVDRPIVVLGASGQVGRALVAVLGDTVVGIDRTRADLADPTSVVVTLADVNPRAIINAAAYTQVDRAETDQELAMTVNAEAPGAIARWAAMRRVPIVHF